MRNDTKLGIWLMVATTIVFAFQDGISRHLAGEYNVVMVIMIRYWFFAAFVIAIAARKTGGLRKVMKTSQPLLQSFRAILLVVEIIVTVVSFTFIGLTETHAVFACYPLLIAALSGPILGEKVGWRRWAAIGVGFIGMLIILDPSHEVFTPLSIIPLVAALLFALYGLLTRYAARKDTAETSFFWTGAVGALFVTVFGFWSWEPMILGDWGWMAVLCLSASLGHWLLIKCYEVAEASAVQPFAYLQLPMASALGIIVFGENLRTNVAIGAAIIVGAGLFTLWRARQKG